MTYVISSPWIHKSLLEELTDFTAPAKYAQAQLIDIIRINDDESVEIRISDKSHQISAHLSSETCKNFKALYAQSFLDIKGCLINIENFTFEFSFETVSFYLNVEFFTYFGSECEIHGDPIDIHQSKAIKEYIAQNMCRAISKSELRVDTKWLDKLDLKDDKRELLTVLINDYNYQSGKETTVITNQSSLDCNTQRTIESSLLTEDFIVIEESEELQPTENKAIKKVQEEPELGKCILNGEVGSISSLLRKAEKFKEFGNLDFHAKEQIASIKDFSIRNKKKTSLDNYFKTSSVILEQNPSDEYSDFDLDACFISEQIENPSSGENSKIEISEDTEKKEIKLQKSTATDNIIRELFTNQKQAACKNLTGRDEQIGITVGSICSNNKNTGCLEIKNVLSPNGTCEIQNTTCVQGVKPSGTERCKIFIDDDLYVMVDKRNTEPRLSISDVLDNVSYASPEVVIRPKTKLGNYIRICGDRDTDVLHNAPKSLDLINFLENNSEEHEKIFIFDLEKDVIVTLLTKEDNCNAEFAEICYDLPEEINKEEIDSENASNICKDRRLSYLNVVELSEDVNTAHDVEWPKTSNKEAGLWAECAKEEDTIVEVLVQQENENIPGNTSFDEDCAVKSECVICSPVKKSKMSFWDNKSTNKLELSVESDEASALELDFSSESVKKYKMTFESQVEAVILISNNEMMDSIVGVESSLQDKNPVFKETALLENMCTKHLQISEAERPKSETEFETKEFNRDSSYIEMSNDILLRHAKLLDINSEVTIPATSTRTVSNDSNSSIILEDDPGFKPRGTVMFSNKISNFDLSIFKTKRRNMGQETAKKTPLLNFSNVIKRHDVSQMDVKIDDQSTSKENFAENDNHFEISDVMKTQNARTSQDAKTLQDEGTRKKDKLAKKYKTFITDRKNAKLYEHIDSRSPESRQGIINVSKNVSVGEVDIICDDDMDIDEIFFNFRIKVNLIKETTYNMKGVKILKKNK